MNTSNNFMIGSLTKLFRVLLITSQWYLLFYAPGFLVQAWLHFSWDKLWITCGQAIYLFGHITVAKTVSLLIHPKDLESDENDWLSPTIYSLFWLILATLLTISLSLWLTITTLFTLGLIGRSAITIWPGLKAGSMLSPMTRRIITSLGFFGRPEDIGDFIDLR